MTASESRATSEDLLLRVAWFYYKDELTQDEIARRLSVSRASVGRMLDRARKVGLVSINLNADHLDAFEVSRQLRRTFQLAEQRLAHGKRGRGAGLIGRGGLQGKQCDITLHAIGEQVDLLLLTPFELIAREHASLLEGVRAETAGSIQH